MINDPTRPVKRLILLSVQLFFTVLLLSCHSTPALAHPSASASDYAKATKLLVRGKNFEHAITLLQIAVKADPKNADYHLALGCAYTDRAASIGFADVMLNVSLQEAKPPFRFISCGMEIRRPRF